MSRLLIAFLVIFVAYSQATKEKETLVLLDNLAIRETHSIFFKTLIGKLIKLYLTCHTLHSHVIVFLHRPRL